MSLANILMHKHKLAVEQQHAQVLVLKQVTKLEKARARSDFSSLIARPDTLAIIFAGGWLKDRLSSSSGSKKMATGSFLWRLSRLVL